MTGNNGTSSLWHRAEGLLARTAFLVNALLAWLVLALVGVVLWFGVIQPWRAHVADLQQQAADKARRLARIEATLRRARGGALKQKERLARQAAADLLPPGDPSLVLADLQTRIGKLVAAHGGTMIEVRPQRPKPENDAVRLGLSVRFRAPVEKAFAILHAMESDRPLLFIDKATVRLFGDPKNRLLIAGKMNAQLLMDIHIHGYQMASGSTK